jgi:hypothetical protein
MSRRVVVAVLLALLSTPFALSAVEKSAPFAIDQWIELKTTEGPVTLHRIRLASQGGITKSKLIRPGGSEYLSDVQIQLEFTNESTDDWKARIRYKWLDANGDVIDGYNGSETLDNESKFEQQTITLSTLRYGLDKAKRVEIEITLERE